MSFFLDALITSFKFLRESVTFLYIQAQIKAKDKDDDQYKLFQRKQKAQIT